MFDWQIALGLELLVILVGFVLFLKADNESKPRTFAKIVAIVVIIFAALLAACTVAKAALYAWRGEDDEAKGSTFIFFNYDDKPEPVRPVDTPKTGADKPAPKKPVAEWEGDLRKAKWHERGEMMKKKWAERNKS